MQDETRAVVGLGENFAQGMAEGLMSKEFTDEITRISNAFYDLSKFFVEAVGSVAEVIEAINESWQMVRLKQERMLAKAMRLEMEEGWLKAQAMQTGCVPGRVVVLLDHRKRKVAKKNYNRVRKALRKAGLPVELPADVKSVLAVGDVVQGLNSSPS